MLHLKFKSPNSLMASHQYISIFLLSVIFSSSCSCTSVKSPSRWALFDSFHIKATRHDLMNPPVAYPAGPVTNPVTTPSLVPPVVTVPATNPIGVTPVNPMPLPVPAANPVTPAVPVTNPVSPAVPATTPVAPVTPAVPVTNPVTGPATGTVPASPPVTIPPPTPGTAVPGTAVSGQSWCVAKTGTQDTSLQSAIDYACGMGGADCSSIQQGAACYNPNTMQNHASVAFNSYYQKNPSPTSCDFGGVAMLTTANPSSGSCVYPTSSSSSSSMTPGTGMPTPATPSSSGAGVGAAPISFGTPPNVLNSSYPAASGANAGLGSPLGATDSLSASIRVQPTIVGCIILMLTWIMVH